MVKPEETLSTEYITEQNNRNISKKLEHFVWQEKLSAISIKHLIYLTAFQCRSQIT